MENNIYKLRKDKKCDHPLDNGKYFLPNFISFKFNSESKQTASGLRNPQNISFISGNNNIKNIPTSYTNLGLKTIIIINFIFENRWKLCCIMP